MRRGRRHVANLSADALKEKNRTAFIHVTCGLGAKKCGAQKNFFMNVCKFAYLWAFIYASTI
jgi:hypothetical protein